MESFNKTHKDLDVWSKSIDLVASIYEITKKLPPEQKYVLVNQMQRSSLSVPSNIAEGACKGSNKEFNRFLNIAIGSLAELETQLYICKKLGYLNSDKVFEDITTIRKMSYGLKKSINKRN